MNLNNVNIMGNLTRDPEMKALPSGAKVTSLSIATNRVWKDQAGAKKEQTDFHNIVVFGRQAETVAQYIKKGTLFGVSGYLSARTWEDNSGQKRKTTEVVGVNITLLEPRKEGSASAVKPQAQEQVISDEDPF